MILLCSLSAVVVLAGCSGQQPTAPNTIKERAGEAAGKSEPLKESKLIIEHNATDEDTGFQGFLDSEGWRRMEVTGPSGQVLTFQAQGSLSGFGLTELFFETVEPENAKVPIEDVLAKLPAGEYKFEGETSNGEPTSGTATLTHDIPAGPILSSPAEEAKVAAKDLVLRWRPVTKTIEDTSVKIVAYQVIVEKDENPPPHRIGVGLSAYLPASATSMRVPDEFLEPDTDYAWEVLAIEESGNQTLSSGSFSTR